MRKIYILIISALCLSKTFGSSFPLTEEDRARLIAMIQQIGTSSITDIQARNDSNLTDSEIAFIIPCLLRETSPSHIAYYKKIKNRADLFLISNYAINLLEDNIDLFHTLFQSNFWPILTAQFDGLLSSLGNQSPPRMSLAIAQAIGHILTLKHMTEDGALTEYHTLERHLGGFSRNCYETIINNFTKIRIQNIGHYFSERHWHGALSHEGSLLGGKDYSYTKYQGTLTLDTKEFPYQICFENESSSQAPLAILINVYGDGILKSDALLDSVSHSITMNGIGIATFECPESTIHQSTQTKNKDNLKETHIPYLRALSTFIAEIKKIYPDAKIFLTGASFGGFFITSYAYLQSIAPHVLYANNFKTMLTGAAFKKFFPDRSFITPIDGIISSTGAIQFMNDIYKTNWINRITIPTLFFWNFDDDRVRLKEDGILDILNTLDNRYIEYAIERSNAAPYLKDHRSETDLNATMREMQRLKLASDNGTSRDITTRRGHFRKSDSFIESMNSFIRKVIISEDNSDVFPDTIAHHERQKRLARIYTQAATNSETYNRIQLQRFLSNQSRLKHYQQRRREENPEFRLSVEEKKEWLAQGLFSATEMAQSDYSERRDALIDDLQERTTSLSMFRAMAKKLYETSLPRTFSEESHVEKSPEEVD